MPSSPNVFQKFSVEGTFGIAAIGLTLLWLVTYALTQFGVIGSSLRLGMPLTVLAIFIAVVSAFKLATGQFEFRQSILTVAVIAAILIAAIYLFPKILPDLFSVGSLQIQGQVQSIIGGLG